MRRGFDIMFPTLEDLHRVEEQYSRTMENYKAKGYVVPKIALQLIRDMYNDRFNKEYRDACWQGREYKTACETRIEMLSRITETKLLQESMDVFKKDPNECFVLGFNNGKPDEQTAEFLNLKDQIGFVNITRTSSLKLPASFSGLEDAKRNDESATMLGQKLFCVFKDGEQVSSLDQNGEEKIVVDTFGAEDMDKFKEFVLDPTESMICDEMEQ